MRFATRAVACLALAFVPATVAILIGTQDPACADTPLTTIRVASGLARPVFVTHAPEDSSRVFIVEQRNASARGRIRILKDGVLLPIPFLTVGPTATGNEEGLLGLAFAPDYQTSKRFYIHYVNSSGNIRIERHLVTANPDSAESTGTEILTIPHPVESNHNGGWIAFGPDGYLYIALGDGGSGGDPNDQAQNPDILLGKILRIDVSGVGYTSPPDNPFAGATPGLDEIWAYGVRNPWRASFDRANGDFYLGDVGQMLREEIDYAPAGTGTGRNYGWRCYEALAPFASSTTNPCGSCADPACPMTFPVEWYEHNLNRCSVTGGYVYRGPAIPDLAGTYFYADYCAALIYTGRIMGGALVDSTDRTAELVPQGGFTINTVSSFGEDAAGELYICDLDGEVFKIVSAASVGLPPPSGPGSGSLLRLLSSSPFKDELRLAVELPREGRVRIDALDTRGRRVRSLVDRELAAGSHPVLWDGRDERGRSVPAGFYFIRARGDDRLESLRVIRVP